MQALLAIARLTFKAGFRFRLVPVLAVILIAAVLILPLVIKDDGTARGLTQIVLTYTLGLITALLGMSTLWLSCGTLAKDVEECQLQVVAAKPVARWQIWVGKWLGIVGLNTLLLGVSAAIVFVQIQWRAQKLPEPQQEILRSEVFVARGSVKEPIPDVEEGVEKLLQERLKNETVAAMDRQEVRKILREQLKAQLQVVPPGYQRVWNLELGAEKEKLRGQPLFLRVKFFSADRSPSGTFMGMWDIGDPASPKHYREVKSQAPETFHEFYIPGDLFNEQGTLTVTFVNQNEVALLFPLEDGMELLYREGGFGLNFCRGVGIVLCWLGLLACVGLAAGSFLSFPVAAFVSLGVLIVAFSTGTMSQVIEQGTVGEVNHETGVADSPSVFDSVAVGAFKVMFRTVNLVRGFSPIDSLSTGRSITWGQLGAAVFQILVVMGGVFAAIGITALTRRELATGQSKV